jgi:spermidine/putrescine transport system substrate-binding protein
MVGARFYLPKDTPVDVLGYWYPSDQRGLVGNDTIVIPTTAPSPRLAHEFLNFFLDEHWGYVNFVDWNGYQPPMRSIVPERLVDEGVVPPSLSLAVLGEENFTKGYLQGELTPDADDLWLDAWSEIQAGG